MNEERPRPQIESYSISVTHSSEGALGDLASDEAEREQLAERFKDKDTLYIIFHCTDIINFKFFQAVLEVSREDLEEGTEFNAQTAVQHALKNPPELEQGIPLQRVVIQATPPLDSQEE